MSQRPLQALNLLVRKHRAPKGTLRRVTMDPSISTGSSQKAPSAKSCIKTGQPCSFLREPSESESTERKRCIKTPSMSHCISRVSPGQEAPSAKRCIKTPSRATSRLPSLPGQKVPSAIRCIKTRRLARHPHTSPVRKHRAPKGALRLQFPGKTDTSLYRQKAPSTKRCIKTRR